MANVFEGSGGQAAGDDRDHDRGITAVIPEPADQSGHRKLRGSRSGRPRYATR